MKQQYILWFKEIRIKDVPLVGGKNASLGEMYRHLTKEGVNIPNGFAITAQAYFYFLKKGKIEEPIKLLLKNFNRQDVKSLQETGKKIRELILKTPLPEDLEKEIKENYRKLCQEYKQKNVDVAVRSSATAEDLPSASFAGQHETYLNIQGEEELLKAVKNTYASLFTDRAIIYREEKGFEHLEVGLSSCIQKMVRSDLASSGVMFTLDTETGFSNVVLINSIFGIGEMIVKGLITSDEFYVFKPTLAQGYEAIIRKDLGRKTKKYIYDKKGGIKEVSVSIKDQLRFSLKDEEILTLAKWGVIIENYYSKINKKWMPQDIEWAKDGKTGELFIVQSRPETVHAISSNIYQEYKLETSKKPILNGIAVGNKIGVGKVRIIKDASKLSSFRKGEVLVTKMTDPDWTSVFPMASAIITDEGSKTCFGKDTKILTNKGFLSIKEIVEKFNKENLKVISLNKKNLKLEWKKVINGFQRQAPLMNINISQTGRVKNNILEVTPDHQFLTFSNRELISEEIQNIIQDKKGIISLLKIPPQVSTNLSYKLAYLLGAISTDGHVVFKQYNKKFSSQIFFIQKNIKSKKNFIEKVKKYFFDEYKYELHLCKKLPSENIIRGKVVKSGGSIVLKCYDRGIVENFLKNQNDIASSLLKAKEEFLFNFLAGVIDGDGTYNSKNNRINIFCSKDYLLEAINIACLRLGINFQVSVNRNIYNIQIVDKVKEIFEYTARVKGKYNREKFGTRFFTAKQLLEDIVHKVNYKGRILAYVKNNLLIDAEKIRNYIIPAIKGEPANHDLTKILDSSLKMLRVNFKNSLNTKDVYNIEVEDNRNYVVFTEKLTPVIVENCHAAIISRELGVPCVVGAREAIKKLKDGQEVTVDCTQGLNGRIFEGKVPFRIKEYNFKKFPKIKTKITMNIGAPEIAFASSFLPNEGVGLAREEFIIAEKIRIHPLALYHYENLKKEYPKTKDKNQKAKLGKIIKQIEELTIEHKDKKEYFVKELAEGIGQIAAAFYPKEVIVRFSDFKTNEYRNLIGGELYEDAEESNPMLGFRGACRYIDAEFKPAFMMECEAIKRAREVFGLKNIAVMVPFCRTIEEANASKELIEKSGLFNDNPKPKFYVMCEIPSNVVLVEEFLDIFDGMSIGSNDLTQLVLGIDRDNAVIQKIGDERNEAVKQMISSVIRACKKRKKYVGICGQAPSDFLEFATFLAEQGIESMSLNPDTVIKTILEISKLKNEN